MRSRIPWRRAALACGLAIPHVLACLPSDSPTPEPDTDHDGLSDREELEVYGTSPLMPDTDGDGITDYDEVVTYAFDPTNDPDRFNPRIADLPYMSIVVTGPPLLTVVQNLADGSTITLTDSVADTSTWGETWGPTWTQGRSDTQSVSQTTTNDMSVSPSTMSQTSVTVPLGSSSSPTEGFVAGADAGPDAESDAGVAPDGTEETPAAQDASEALAGAEEEEAAAPSGATLTQTQGDSLTLTFDNSVSTTVNPSTTIDASVSFTDQQMRQYSETLSRERAVATSHQVTSLLGSLKVSTVIQNRSHVGFRISNVLLSATLIGPGGTLTPIGNLQLDQGLITTFQPFALSPGEQTGPTTFENTLLDLQITNSILASGRGVLIRLATYELDNADGKPYAFDSTAIGSKTALVAIDYGHGSARQPELYQVATNFQPDRPGVSASQLFQDILHLPYTASVQTGLTTVRDLSAVASGASHWSVALVHDEGPNIVTTTYGDAAGDPYDFDGIAVHAGDVLHLAFVGAGGSAAYDGGIPATQLGAGPPANNSFRVTGPPTDASFQ